MKNKFAYNYSRLFKFILAIWFICWAAIFFVNVFRLASVLGFYTRDTVQEITCVAVSVIALAVWICLITMKYKVTDKIALKFGPFDLTRGKFLVEKMIKIVQSSKDDALYINLYVGEEARIAIININPKHYDAFAECVRSKNGKVLVDKADIEK